MGRYGGADSATDFAGRNVHRSIFPAARRHLHVSYPLAQLLAVGRRAVWPADRPPTWAEIQPRNGPDDYDKPGWYGRPQIATACKRRCATSAHAAENGWQVPFAPDQHSPANADACFIALGRDATQVAGRCQG